IANAGPPRAVGRAMPAGATVLGSVPCFAALSYFIYETACGVSMLRVGANCITRSLRGVSSRTLRGAIRAAICRSQIFNTHQISVDRESRGGSVSFSHELMMPPSQHH